MQSTSQMMTSTKEIALSQNIAADVESAATSFKRLQENMKNLVDALKEQHSSMQHASEKRLMAAKQFESFVIKTPLAEIAGDFGMSQAKASLVGSQRSTTKIQEEAPYLVETESEASPPSSPDSRHSDKSASTDEDNNNVDAKEDEDDDTTESPTAGEDTADVATPTSKDTELINPSVEQTYQTNKTTPPPVVKPVLSTQQLVVGGTDAEDSYAAVHKSIHDLSTMYTQQYNHEIILYAENWSKAVSDRVKARQLQFQELEKKLTHYSKKVDGLRDKHNGSPGKLQDRLERNELKLRGAREAYDNSGQSLVLLVEELTERAWKDFYPLLLRCMTFDVEYETDMAKIFAKLHNALPRLEEIGEDHKLDPNGRLQSIETSHPEELYTGTKRIFVRPVLES